MWQAAAERGRQIESQNLAPRFPDPFRITFGNQYRADMGCNFRFGHIGHEPLPNAFPRRINRRSKINHTAPNVIQERFI